MIVSITVRLFLNRLECNFRRGKNKLNVQVCLIHSKVTLPDYEERRDTVVADGSEPHAERLDFSGQQEEVVHKGSG